MTIVVEVKPADTIPPPNANGSKVPFQIDEK